LSIIVAFARVCRRAKVTLPRDQTAQAMDRNRTSISGLWPVSRSCLASWFREVRECRDARATDWREADRRGRRM